MVDVGAQVRRRRLAGWARAVAIALAAVAVSGAVLGASSASAAKVTGPQRVVPGAMVTYRAFDFAPNERLRVEINAQHRFSVWGNSIRRVRTNAAGRATVRFRWPLRYSESLYGGSERWKSGQRFWVRMYSVDVNDLVACGSKPEKPDLCADRGGHIVSGKQSGHRLPVEVIPVRGRAGGLTLECPLAQRCRGTIVIRRGKRALIRPRRYSIKPHASKRLSLRLTPAGRRALKRSGRVKGMGVVRAANGKKAKFTAILRRG